MAPSTSSLANTTIFRTPGFGMIGYIHEALRYGEQIRDEWVWEFPLLDGAIFTFQQMAAGREWRVSGPASQASRCVDWLNNAISYNEDGTIDRGWVQFESRRVPDHLCVGRTMFAFRDELEYLDPVQWRYNMEDNIWENIRTEETYRTDEVVVHHPIPLGAGGRFRAPLSSLIPTAMLAWLIREHDRASADGRKIRDITLVVTKDLAEQIDKAIKVSLELWSGANPASTGAPIAFIDPGMNTGNIKASDYVTRVGLANIPDNFDREQFQFQYVNEIADITGLALRHIWNSEKATNRALEERISSNRL